MGEGFVEVFQHGGAAGALLHGLIAGPHGGWHFALAHVTSHHGGTLRQVSTDRGQNVVEVLGCAAEAGGAEEKYLLFGDLAQEIGHRGITVSLIGPEAHIEHIGGQSLGGGGATVKAILRRQSGLDGQSKLLCVSGLTAVNDGVTHLISSFHRYSGRLCGP